MDIKQQAACDVQSGRVRLPMTRRLKCRIDPELSPHTCMLPEHKPVRHGREMIDLLAAEEPKLKRAKNGRYRTRQRSTSCLNACRRLVRP